MIELKDSCETTEKTHTNYPSRYKIGEKVTLDLIETRIIGCEVDAVRFTEDKVRYDILIPLSYNNQLEVGWTKIENVDSVFIAD